MSRRVMLAREVKRKVEPQRKRVLIGRKCADVDPKPDDLAMTRMKQG